MTQRSLDADAVRPEPATVDLPAPELAAFIGYCHRRRGATWPELYDEMCGVAARREFNGWDHAQLAQRGLTFSLFDMPRLAAWSRAVLEAVADQQEVDGRPGAAAHLTQRTAVA